MDVKQYFSNNQLNVSNGMQAVVRDCDSFIKVGSHENHFNVLVGSDGQSHKTVSTNHNHFEEKGELKRYRTAVLPLTSLTTYR